MIYARIDQKWYKTVFSDIGEITMIAWDYIELMYIHEPNLVACDVIRTIGSSDSNSAIELEFWMIKDKEKLPMFDEWAFIKDKE